MAAGISINRIRLEFKGQRLEQSHDVAFRINRIRLEFKVSIFLHIPPEEGTRINRIRLEFKVHMDYENGRFLIAVLIESDWNLKWDVAMILNAMSAY